ncbi:MAG: hypothetical protein WC435_00290 [Candidatus Paceibacterota bacterium]
MQRIKRVKNEDAPRWHSLGISEDKKSFVIKIERNLFYEWIVKRMNNDSPLLKSLEGTFSEFPLFFENLFVLPTEEEWGIWGVFKKIEEDDVWVTFNCELPRVLSFLDKEEQKKALKIISLMAEEVDFLSYETGLERRNHKLALAIRASLFVLFFFLESAEEDCFPSFERVGGKKQILLIKDFHFEQEMHGGSFSAELSPSAVSFIRRKVKESGYERIYLPFLKKAMLFCHRHIWEEEEGCLKLRIEAEGREDGRLFLSVPGDACELNAENYETIEGYGYEMFPHNVDDSVQQLTLLCGLAALSDWIENET